MNHVGVRCLVIYRVKERNGYKVRWLNGFLSECENLKEVKIYDRTNRMMKTGMMRGACASRINASLESG